jgi:hypothetical protein
VADRGEGLVAEEPDVRRGAAHPGLARPEAAPAGSAHVLKTLVERDGKVRSDAIFALAYWTAGRLSDVSWLNVENVHVRPKVGWRGEASSIEDGSNATTIGVPKRIIAAAASFMEIATLLRRGS